MALSFHLKGLGGWGMEDLMGGKEGRNIVDFDLPLVYRVRAPPALFKEYVAKCGTLFMLIDGAALDLVTDALRLIPSDNRDTAVTALGAGAVDAYQIMTTAASRGYACLRGDEHVSLRDGVRVYASYDSEGRSPSLEIFKDPGDAAGGSASAPAPPEPAVAPEAEVNPPKRRKSSGKPTLIE